MKRGNQGEVAALGEAGRHCGQAVRVPPSRRAVDDALAFLLNLPPDSDPPHVAASGDGEVVFDWRGHDFWLDVGFFGDGKICYCVKKSMSSPADSYEDDFVQRRIPRRLLEEIPRTRSA